MGRLFTASESAYNGSALRMRADLFDRMVSKAERLGVDITDLAELKSRGKLANSMTGRGNIGKLEVVAEPVNAALFSIKFLKSNFDTLTAHSFDSGITKSVRVEAALNSLKTIGATAAILATAEILYPGSVKKDLKSLSSSLFGKISIGNRHYDVSAGMAGIVTLASRLVPVQHKGKWGWWYNEKFTDFGSYKYGQPTPIDALYSFGENKTSPLFSSFISVLRQKSLDNEVPTPKSLIKGLIQPLPVGTFEDLQNDPNSSEWFLSMLLSELGIGITVYKAKK